MSEPPAASAPILPLTRRVEWGIGCACALGVLALTFLLVPDYWSARGLPLDDAWIHAVYARALAQGEGLSYNPGVPATGETSPLWALVLALVHLGHPAVSRVVLLTKLLGFLLHVLTAAGWYGVLRDVGRRWAASAALLVLVSPPLVAASLSGMEVPLATLAAVSFLGVLRGPRPGLYVLCGALGPLARPEVGLLLFVLPLVVRTAPGWWPVVGYWLRAIGGGVLGGGAWAAWNLYASGRPLPATFYAKVNVTPTSMSEALGLSFTRLLPPASWPLPLLVLLAVGALVIGLLHRRATRTQRLAAGLVFAAGLFWFTSVALLRSPRSGDFFAHQRYVLPAVPFLLVALPLMMGEGLEARLARRLPWLPSLVAVALPLALLAGLGPRLARLENDAHNTDDLQVQEGLFLSRFSPTDTVWVLDAGASRYFGQAFVVDVIGLNTPQLLTPDAQAYLDAHPPRLLEWTQSWAAVLPDSVDHVREARRFQTSTPYTTAPTPTMSRRLLLECTPGSSGLYLRKANRWRYHCAGGASALPVESPASTTPTPPLTGDDAPEP